MAGWAPIAAGTYGRVGIYGKGLTIHFGKQWEQWEKIELFTHLSPYNHTIPVQKSH